MFCFPIRGRKTPVFITRYIDIIIVFICHILIWMGAEKNSMKKAIHAATNHSELMAEIIRLVYQIE